MNRKQLSDLGIISSSSKLYSEFGFLIGKSSEKSPSFWTTQFHPLQRGLFALESTLTAEFQINFKDEECAASFLNQISGEDEKAKKYFWNGFLKKENIEFHLSDDEKSIIFKYGDMDYENN